MTVKIELTQDERAIALDIDREGYRRLFLSIASGGGKPKKMIRATGRVLGWINRWKGYNEPLFVVLALPGNDCSPPYTGEAHKYYRAIRSCQAKLQREFGGRENAETLWNGAREVLNSALSASDHGEMADIMGAPADEVFSQATIREVRNGAFRVRASQIVDALLPPFDNAPPHSDNSIALPGNEDDPFAQIDDGPLRSFHLPS